MADAFNVIVWCHDCGNGQDPYGCFNGGQELVGSFPTEAEAEAFADKKRKKRPAPWQYDVVPTLHKSEGESK